MSSGTPTAPRVLLGVSGGIAAYKACEVIRRLRDGGADVTVVPTASALRFVGAPTFEALSGHRVSSQVWDGVDEVRHVALGQQADLVLVVPATADLLARATHGRANDLLTASLLVARCPIVMAPAMHTEMWQHPATQANVATLRERGVVVLDPAVGRLTGLDTGPGRLPDPDEIARTALQLLRHGVVKPDLAGRHIVVSAGGTREPLDPVRFLGNRSSGRQGYAIARAAAARGATVTLVSANPTLPGPAGVTVVAVSTAAELRDAVLDASASADAVVMAAAVADFRPTVVAESKVKKDLTEVPQIVLQRTDDVLSLLVASKRHGQVVVGFAAETGDATAGWLDLGRAKLARKQCDILVVNEVGAELGFESDDNSAVILTSNGAEINVAFGPKDDLAHTVLDVVALQWH
jgi:phosphopantothenoylcysteine decarboxylase/phosphopantothenate--cysteine ligase